jgi:hypothetical protein
MQRYFLLVLIPTVGLCGPGASGQSSGGPSGGGSTPTPSTATVRSASEQTISGGAVQLKYLLSQPRPITYADFDVPSDGFSLDGVASSGPGTDASGVALSTNGFIHVSINSPDSTFGTDGYPILTLTLTAPQLPAGTQIAAPIQAISMNGPNGPIILNDEHPPTITIGGSLSVSGIYPGGGTWPAETVISIRGSGFQPHTNVNAHLQAGKPVYVSANEIQLTLTHEQTLDRTLFTITNPDGSQQDFYAYPKGKLIQTPSIALLQQADPIFSAALHSSAKVTIPAAQSSQFAAIALQSFNTGAISVTLKIAATGETIGVYMPSQSRLAEDLSVLFGRKLQAGEEVSISATSPIQMVGIFGDQNASTVAPLVLSY